MINITFVSHLKITIQLILPIKNIIKFKFYHFSGSGLLEKTPPGAYTD